MLNLHHIGILVNNMDDAIESYRLLFGELSVSEKIIIDSQAVNVCFVNTGNNIFLELIEAIDNNSLVSKMLKKGITYYHLAYLTKDFETDLKRLIGLYYKPYEVFYSEAFKQKRCQFLFSPVGHLIEIIEE